MEHLTGPHEQLFLLVLSNPEAEDTFEDVRQLLVLVRVFRHDAPLLEVHVGEHHPISRDEPSFEHRRDLLAGKLLPTVPGHGASVGGSVRCGHEKTRDW